MIAFVHGPDAALARAAVARLASEHDPDGSTTSTFDARETPLPHLVVAAGSAGFFGAGRVVIVRDLIGRSRKADGVEPVDGRGGAIDVGPLFAVVPPENLLILHEPALASVPAAVRKAAPPDMIAIAGEPPRGRELIAWLRTAAADAGGSIAPGAAQLLAASLYPQTWASKPNNPRYDRPPDLDLLRGQIETLALYAHPNPVSEAHVRELTPGMPDERIFRFMEAAAAGDVAAAATELERLLLAGEEPAKLAAQVFGQIELGAIAAAARGQDPARVGREIGLSNPNQMVAIARTQRGG
ncbi:MAG: hypothetical protein IT337_09825, partial [Thermomicrobiales bacterium]|nr:hypothetical protein [Thermomicrobiales bacterium]